MAIQQPTSNYRRPSIQNLELADFNNVKRSRSSSFSNQDDATASLSHNSQITTDKNAGSQVEQSNMLLHALKGFGVKSSKQQQQINFGPDTGNDSTDNIAEW